MQQITYLLGLWAAVNILLTAIGAIEFSQSAIDSQLCGQPWIYFFFMSALGCVASNLLAVTISNCVSAAVPSLLGVVTSSVLLVAFGVAVSNFEADKWQVALATVHLFVSLILFVGSLMAFGSWALRPIPALPVSAPRRRTQVRRPVTPAATPEMLINIEEPSPIINAPVPAPRKKALPVIPSAPPADILPTIYETSSDTDDDIR